MPASSQASSELSTASLTAVSSALRGLSNPSRWRFFVKNSLTEISRCCLASCSAVRRWATGASGRFFRRLSRRRRGPALRTGFRAARRDLGLRFRRRKSSGAVSSGQRIARLRGFAACFLLNGFLTRETTRWSYRIAADDVAAHSRPRPFRSQTCDITRRPLSPRRHNEHDGTVVTKAYVSMSVVHGSSSHQSCRRGETPYRRGESPCLCGETGLDTPTATGQ